MARRGPCLWNRHREAFAGFVPGQGAIWRQPVEAVLLGLKSGPQGLSAAESARRLGGFGKNRIEAVQRPSLGRRFAGEFTHFFALILWLAAALAFIAERYDPGQGMGELGWAIVGVIVINGSFSFWQAYRTERALAALRQLLPERVNARREGTAVAVAAEDVVHGDVLLLQKGDNVPADCRLIEAVGLRVNPLLGLGIAFELMLILAVIYAPPGQCPVRHGAAPRECLAPHAAHGRTDDSARGRRQGLGLPGYCPFTGGMTRDVAGVLDLRHAGRCRNVQTAIVLTPSGEFS